MKSWIEAIGIALMLFGECTVMIGVALIMPWWIFLPITLALLVALIWGLIQARRGRWG